MKTSFQSIDNFSTRSADFLTIPSEISLELAALSIPEIRISQFEDIMTLISR